MEFVITKVRRNLLICILSIFILLGFSTLGFTPVYILSIIGMVFYYHIKSIIISYKDIALKSNKIISREFFNEVITEEDKRIIDIERRSLTLFMESR